MKNKTISREFLSFNNKMSEYPQLFYGINLDRIPKERRNLPSEVIIPEAYPEPERINAERLEGLVQKEGLKLFVTGEEYGSLVEEGGGYDYEQVHIGISIKDNYVQGTRVDGKQRFYEEFVMFDIGQILILKKNPSNLIKKLKRIKLNVSQKDLALYGVSAID